MPEDSTKYRLLTRSDMDGLVCAVLLKELDMLGEISFQHPKDMQDGLVAVTERDILTNLPYVPGCGMCFDHHASESLRNEGKPTPGYILQPDAKSAARVVYDHFGGRARFPRVSDAMMEAVDKADSAGFNRDDVLHPKPAPDLFLHAARMLGADPARTTVVEDCLLYTSPSPRD